jgi:CheY-like chemotaxis protein
MDRKLGVEASLGDARMSPSSPPSAAKGAEPVYTVLVVEDEPLVRLSTAEVLRDCGFQVFEAKNADDAIAIFKAGHQIHLLFTDIALPGPQDGLLLADWVGRQFPGAKIVVTSGFASNGAMPNYDGRFGKVISKPYSLDDLSTHFRACLTG